MVPFRLFHPPSLHSQQTVYSSPPSCSCYSAPKGKHARKYFSKGEKEANFYDGENMFGCLTSSGADSGFPQPARPFRSSWCCKPAGVLRVQPHREHSDSSTPRLEEMQDFAGRTCLPLPGLSPDHRG